MIIYTALSIGILVAVVAAGLYALFTVAAPIERQLPEDLPSDLFDGKPASKATIESDAAATSEFRKSFGVKVRERLGKMWCATSEFFFIQKRY